MTHALSDQSLIKIISSHSAKKKRRDYFYGDVDKAITKTQTGGVSQAKAVQ